MSETMGEALQVLSVAQRRDVRSRRYDAECQRLLPKGWNGLDEAAPPSFTTWEALTLARQLPEIGAGSQVDRQRP